jgi:hypothetical protein
MGTAAVMGPTFMRNRKLPMVTRFCVAVGAARLVLSMQVGNKG